MPTTINHLSNEILHIIIDDLSQPGWPREWLLNARLVCRRFQQLTHAHVFRTMVFPLGTALPRCTMALLEHLQTAQGKRFKSLSPPLYGNHVLLDEIPRELLAILNCLYPRVSVNIELGGSLHECYQILKDYSCFHALDLAATVSSNGAQPHARADFAISSIMRQASLTRLSVTCGPDWQFAFSNDSGDYKPLRLNEISLKSNEYAGLHVPSHRMLLRAFVDRNALKVIRIHRYWLIASVFDDIKSKLPNLQSVAIDGSNGKVVGPRSTSLMSAEEYISVADFFRKTVLRAIAFHNITQRMPWVDLVATSGCKLTQLVIHTSYDDWLCAMSNWSNNFGGLIPPSSPFGVSQEELYQLNITCPNIERLGVDISDLRVTEARHSLLDALTEYHQLRHLHLFFHPSLEPNTSPEVAAYFSGVASMALRDPRYRGAQSMARRPIARLENVTGLDLVKLFLHLRDGKKGRKLETLLYRQKSHAESVECMLWHMGGCRVLLSFRYHHDTEWREMYEGTKLVKSEKRLLDQGTLFGAETFPA
ncbi:MAG: hypothetical protein Q9186_006483 [Xanthomendoza sp. 1 TL-2023]